MEDPCALQLTLYYDDLEVCNPFGSKAKIHKLGTYYTYNEAKVMEGMHAKIMFMQ